MDALAPPEHLHEALVALHIGQPHRRPGLVAVTVVQAVEVEHGKVDAFGVGGGGVAQDGRQRALAQGSAPRIRRVHLREHPGGLVAVRPQALDRLIGSREVPPRPLLAVVDLRERGLDVDVHDDEFAVHLDGDHAVRSEVGLSPDRLEGRTAPLQFLAELLRQPGERVPVDGLRDQGPT
jgi:hypothetical protein